MFHPRSRPFLTLSIFCAAAVYGVAADPPPAPQDSKHTTQAPAKEQAPKPAPGKGVVVFVDPATGQIRQPTASEIGDLSPSPNPVAPKAPEPSLMQGPGGSVGAKLGEDSLTYMVVTAAPDGKLAMDCVTGSKAADAQVRPPAPPSKPARPQDTHDVKVPR
jgi:hypothetical protein